MGVRLRYTILYGVLFGISGLGLLALTNVLSVSRSAPVGTSPPEQVADLREQLAQASSDQARQLLVGSAVALAIMLVISLFLGRLAAGRVLRPLRVITAATRRISADNLHERLAVTGPADEIKALADTVDDLLGRLEEAFAAQRRFVADASHELRTPLATMRASLDVAVAKPGPVPSSTVALADRIRRELDQVDQLLDGFLTLARAQHGALDDRAPVSLTALAASALDDRSGLEVYADRTALIVDGNPVLLSRMVANVIDNAVVHNVPGGWVRVTVVGGALVVENGGPVLSPEEVARLGRPFQRLGADRTGAGSGLGLSIAGAVAAAHGGSLDLAARPGGGLRVTVALPPAAPPLSPSGLPA
jgi:signal transduction histidine kinase